MVYSKSVKVLRSWLHVIQIIDWLNLRESNRSIGWLQDKKVELLIDWLIDWLITMRCWMNSKWIVNYQFFPRYEWIFVNCRRNMRLLSTNYFLCNVIIHSCLINYRIRRNNVGQKWQRSWRKSLSDKEFVQIKNLKRNQKLILKCKSFNKNQIKQTQKKTAVTSLSTSRDEGQERR